MIYGALQMLLNKQISLSYCIGENIKVDLFQIFHSLHEIHLGSPTPQFNTLGKTKYFAEVFIHY